jgi:methanogenic corrinoid protein MtbC1
MGSSKHISLVRDTGPGETGQTELRPGKSGPDAASTAPVETTAPDSVVSVLAQAIQHEIIPRLMLAHRTPVECSAPYDNIAEAISPADVSDFAHVLLKGSEANALQWIEDLRHKGSSIETIYLDLLAPVARHLGDMWNEDLCDFTDVTIGLGQLHKILHILHDKHDRQQYPLPNGLSVLLMPAPGEQHTLGLTMVSDFFQRAGWEVAGGPYAASDDPVVLVKKRAYDAVGFSLATSMGLNRLKECITAVRASAAPSTVCIIVGGPYFSAHPDQVTHVGADLLVQDASSAPELAQLHIGASYGNQKARVFNH